MDTFHFTPFACSLAAHCLMHELEHPHRAIVLRGNPDGAGDPSYAEIHPARTVPALVTKDGVLTQSSAILLHLAAIHPERELLPDERAASGRVLGWLGYFTADIHPSFRALFRPDRLVEDAAGRAQLLNRGRVHVSRQLEIAERQLGDSLFVAGDQLSIADPYVLAFSYWSRYHGIAFPPRLAALATRLAARPGFQRALAIETREYAAQAA